MLQASFYIAHFALHHLIISPTFTIYQTFFLLFFCVVILCLLPLSSLLINAQRAPHWTMLRMLACPLPSLHIMVVWSLPRKRSHSQLNSSPNTLRTSHLLTLAALLNASPVVNSRENFVSFCLWSCPFPLWHTDFFALDFETTGLTRKELPRILEISLEHIPEEKLPELQAPPPPEGAQPSNIDPQSQCSMESPTATDSQYYSLIDPGIPSSVSLSTHLSVYLDANSCDENKIYAYTYHQINRSDGGGFHRNRQVGP